MTLFVFANNVNTQLAGSISSSATSLTLASAFGLPASIPAGYCIAITLNDAATQQNFEIIYATAVSGSTLSGLLRGQEGTHALAWNVGDFAYSPPTAGQMRNALQIPNLHGALLGPPTVITASRNWTPNPLANMTVFLAVAGGGAGGSTQNVSSGQGAASCGGCSGAACQIAYSVSLGSSPFFVTIGSGGAAVSTAGANGGNGGTTSIGSFLNVPGGPGGTFGPSVAPYYVQNQQSFSVANPTFTGSPIIIWQQGTAVGGVGVVGGINANQQQNGAGGTTPYGHSASGFGAGGSGAQQVSGGSFVQGNPGRPGFLAIWEFN